MLRCAASDRQRRRCICVDLVRAPVFETQAAEHPLSPPRFLVNMAEDEDMSLLLTKKKKKKVGITFLPPLVWTEA